jgi:ketosteroid isomerase-like protein
VGAQAYRKDWQDVFAMFNGPVKFEITDLAIMADQALASSHSIQHVTGTQLDGRYHTPAKQASKPRLQRPDFRLVMAASVRRTRRRAQGNREHS